MTKRKALQRVASTGESNLESEVILRTRNAFRKGGSNKKPERGRSSKKDHSREKRKKAPTNRNNSSCGSHTYREGENSQGGLR